MKNLKFRVWDKKYGMFQVDSIDFVNNSCSYLIDFDHINNTQVDEEEFEFAYAELGNMMQYTGMKDKNGVEIYEGDLVRVDISLISHTKEVTKYEVVWTEDTTLGYGWGLWSVEGKGYLRLNGFGEYEIVGHVYD